jgi:hypothetical protein
VKLAPTILTEVAEREVDVVLVATKPVVFTVVAVAMPILDTPEVSAVIKE